MGSERWPDSTDVHEFFLSHVQAETRLDAERLESIVQSLLDEGLGTFGVLRAILNEYSNDTSISPAKILQTCIEPPLPLGVCFVLAKHLQSKTPAVASPPQLSAMNLLVKATRAGGEVQAESSSEEEAYDLARAIGLPPSIDSKPNINVITAKVETTTGPVVNHDQVETRSLTRTLPSAPTTTVRHSGTHQCPYCPKRFQYCHLQDHIRSHTGEKPFRCPHCKKFFSRNSTMRRHVKRLHKLPPPESQHVPPHVPPASISQYNVEE